MIGTGETHSVQEFVEIAFDYVGLDWRNHVVVDPKFYRPAEVDLLMADPAKAQREAGLGAAVDFEGLVRMMVDHDLARLGFTAPPPPEWIATPGLRGPVF